MTTQGYTLLFEIRTKGSGKARDEIEGTGKAAKKASVDFRTLKTAVAGFLGALAVREVVAFGASIGRAYTDAVRASNEFTKSQRVLDGVIASTGDVIGVNRSELTAWAQELDRTTLFTEQQANSALALAGTFTNLSRESMREVLNVSADVATVMGTDLPSATKQLAKAINEPEKRLAELAEAGVTFTDQQMEMIEALAETDRQAAQMEALRIVAEQTGDAAEAAAMGAGVFGQLRQELARTQIIVGSTGSAFEPLGIQILEIVRAMNDGLETARSFGDILLLVGQRAVVFFYREINEAIGFVLLFVDSLNALFNTLGAFVPGMEKAAQATFELSDTLRDMQKANAEGTIKGLTRAQELLAGATEEAAGALGTQADNLEDVAAAAKEAEEFAQRVQAAIRLDALEQAVARLKEIESLISSGSATPEQLVDLTFEAMELREEIAEATKVGVETGIEEIDVDGSLSQKIADAATEGLGSKEAEDAVQGTMQRAVDRIDWGSTVATLVDALGGVEGLFGVGGNAGGTNGFGGRNTRDYAREGRQIGSIFGPWGALIGEILGGLTEIAGEEIQAFIGNQNVTGELTSQLLGAVNNEFRNNVQLFVDSIIGTFNDLFAGFGITGDDIDVSQLELRIKDGVIEVVSEGITRSFEDANAALDFAITELARTGVFESLPGFAQSLINASGALSNGNLEQFAADLDLIERITRPGLTDSARGLEEFNMELRRMQDRIFELIGSGGIEDITDALRGLSEFAFGELQQIRNSILGIEESPAERLARESAEFNKALFDTANTILEGLERAQNRAETLKQIAEGGGGGIAPGSGPGGTRPTGTDLNGELLLDIFDAFGDIIGPGNAFNGGAFTAEEGLLDGVKDLITSVAQSVSDGVEEGMSEADQIIEQAAIVAGILADEAVISGAVTIADALAAAGLKIADIIDPALRSALEEIAGLQITQDDQRNANRGNGAGRQRRQDREALLDFLDDLNAEALPELAQQFRNLALEEARVREEAKRLGVDLDLVGDAFEGARDRLEAQAISDAQDSFFAFLAGADSPLKSALLDVDAAGASVVAQFQALADAGLITDEQLKELTATTEEAGRVFKEGILQQEFDDLFVSALRFAGRNEDAARAAFEITRQELLLRIAALKEEAVIRVGNKVLIDQARLDSLNFLQNMVQGAQYFNNSFGNAFPNNGPATTRSPILDLMDQMRDIISGGGSQSLSQQLAALNAEFAEYLTQAGSHAAAVQLVNDAYVVATQDLLANALQPLIDMRDDILGGGPASRTGIAAALAEVNRLGAIALGGGDAGLDAIDPLFQQASVLRQQLNALDPNNVQRRAIEAQLVALINALEDSSIIGSAGDGVFSPGTTSPIGVLNNTTAMYGSQTVEELRTSNSELVRIRRALESQAALAAAG